MINLIKLALNSLLKIVESVRVLVSDCNVHLLAHGQDVLISHATKWFWILLECEVCCAPLFEQCWQHISRLTSDDEETRVEFPQT